MGITEDPSLASRTPRTSKGRPSEHRLVGVEKRRSDEKISVTFGKLGTISSFPRVTSKGRRFFAFEEQEQPTGDEVCLLEDVASEHVHHHLHGLKLPNQLMQA